LKNNRGGMLVATKNSSYFVIFGLTGCLFISSLVGIFIVRNEILNLQIGGYRGIIIAPLFLKG